MSSLDFTFTINDIQDRYHLDFMIKEEAFRIYNSQKSTNTNDLFMVVPVTMVATFSTGGALVAPVAGNAQLFSTK